MITNKEHNKQQIRATTKSHRGRYKSSSSPFELHTRMKASDSHLMASGVFNGKITIMG